MIIIYTHQSNRLLQKQNFIGSIYIFIGMLGHRLPVPPWNVSDFEFSDVYFIIWFYVSSIWLRITIVKTLRSRISRLDCEIGVFNFCTLYESNIIYIFSSIVNNNISQFYRRTYLKIIFAQYCQHKTIN